MGNLEPEERVLDDFENKDSKYLCAGEDDSTPVYPCIGEGDSTPVYPCIGEGD